NGNSSTETARDRRDPGKGKVRRTLDASVGDGIGNSAMSAVTDTFMLPLAVAMNASASQAAQLAALPSLGGAGGPKQATRLVDVAGGRRKALNVLIGLQASLVWLFPLLLVFPVSSRYPGLLGLAIAYVTCNNLLSPIWGSLIADSLPVSRRSGYLGWRG